MTGDPGNMHFFLDRGADAVTGDPFAVAFREKVELAFQLFVDYRKDGRATD